MQQTLQGSRIEVISRISLVQKNITGHEYRTITDAYLILRNKSERNFWFTLWSLAKSNGNIWRLPEDTTTTATIKLTIDETLRTGSMSKTVSRNVIKEYGSLNFFGARPLFVFFAAAILAWKYIYSNIINIWMSIRICVCVFVLPGNLTAGSPIYACIHPWCAAQSRPLSPKPHTLNLGHDNCDWPHSTAPLPSRRPSPNYSLLLSSTSMWCVAPCASFFSLVAHLSHLSSLHRQRKYHHHFHNNPFSRERKQKKYHIRTTDTNETNETNFC